MATGEEIALDSGFLFHVGDQNGLVMSLRVVPGPGDDTDFRVQVVTRPGLTYQELTHKVQDALFERKIEVIREEGS